MSVVVSHPWCSQRADAMDGASIFMAGQEKPGWMGRSPMSCGWQEDTSIPGPNCEGQGAHSFGFGKLIGTGALASLQGTSFQDLTPPYRFTRDR